MKRLLAGLAIVAFSLIPLAANAAGGTPRALWVWSTAGLRQDPASAAEFFSFLAAPHDESGRAIGTIFFDGMRAGDFQDDAAMAAMRKFVVDAHQKSIRVDFLCGDPTWATPQSETDGLGYVTAVLDYNKKSPLNARFDGFQFDVEPYVLHGAGGWPSVAIENGLIDLLQRSRDAITASGQHLILSQTIPRWFSGTKFDSLGHRVIDIVDEVAVMDYVTTVNQLVNDPADILAYAALKHKAVWIGVETSPLPDTPRSTFFGIGNAAMESELASALPAFQAQSSFRGYAINQYARYQALKP